MRNPEHESFFFVNICAKCRVVGAEKLEISYNVIQARAKRREGFFICIECPFLIDNPHESRSTMNA